MNKLKLVLAVLLINISNAPELTNVYDLQAECVVLADRAVATCQALLEKYGHSQQS